MNEHITLEMTKTAFPTCEWQMGWRITENLTEPMPCPWRDAEEDDEIVVPVFDACYDHYMLKTAYAVEGEVLDGHRYFRSKDALLEFLDKTRSMAREAYWAVQDGKQENDD